MRSMADALAKAGVDTGKRPITDKNFQAARNIRDAQISIRDTDASMMRDACAPTARPSKKRDKVIWPTRSNVGRKQRGNVVVTHTHVEDDEHKVMRAFVRVCKHGEDVHSACRAEGAKVDVVRARINRFTKGRA